MTTNPLTLTILPEDTPARIRLVEAAREAGHEVLAPGAAGAAAILLDLAAPGAVETLARLRAHDAWPGVALLGVLPAGSEKASGAELHQCGDFVALESVARELAPRLQRAIAQKRQHDEFARRERDLKALLHVTAEYAATLDAATVLHDVIRRLAEELSIDRCALVLVDQSQTQGFIIAASDAVAPGGVHIDLSRYPEILEALRTRKPVVVDDAPSHPLLERVKDEVAKVGIAALAAVPLILQDKVLGVLLLRASAKARVFTSREIDFASIVAHATAVAIRNARVLETMRGEARRAAGDKRRAEEALVVLKHYEEFFVHISDGIAILDSLGAFLSLNPAGEQILEVRSAEARGRHFATVVNPTDQAMAQDLLRSVSKGASRRDLDIEARTRGGRRVILAVSASPLTDQGEAVVSFRDVTASRDVERELRKTKDFLERVIDSSGDGIIASDMRGAILVFNQGAERITNYSAEEAVAGRLNVRALYLPGVAQQVLRKTRSEQYGGKGRLEPTRTEIVTKSGERVPVSMTAAIVYDGDREIGTVGVFSDLRERDRLEQKLTQAQERVAVAEKQALVAELAGTAAHELNQPLTSIMGYAEILRRKLKEDDPFFRPVDIIFRETERMADIVRKIGKITRYETKAYLGDAKIIDIDKAAPDE